MKAARVQRLILQRSKRWGRLPHVATKKDAVRRARPHDREPKLRGERVAAYVILDEADRVIYAGQTAKPAARMAQHRTHGRLDSSCSVVWLVCPDRERAIRVEDLAIAVLNPRDNIRGSDFQWEDQRGISLDELEALPALTLADRMAGIGASA